MKRGLENEESVILESMDITKCLMFMFQGLETKPKPDHSVDDNVFECKTCRRRFLSFQALGGHRSSHKKPRLTRDNEESANGSKAKIHECAICGKGFAMGQALGGHMRKHRASINETWKPAFPSNLPVYCRSNGESLDLDLNLTPLDNGLRAIFGKMAPKFDLSF
ncbi:Detected protein of unknown function [Hibiscus syriacus]|uniref:C2H2-type domain-containing protein n=1 Tax=Hibiscus syriacus TaxID=106335 RepID=A0A6A3ASY8_HIBSY|nr:zinc finger protein ZAT11-like [Hibiscus syriacus]KAE8706009.1 Detected protein of unknown function [Hibiscus syriacus]